MTGLADLLAECTTHGVQLFLADRDGLTIDAPAGVLTPDLIGRLRAHKPELLAALNGSQAVANAPRTSSSNATLDFTGWQLRPDHRGRLGWEAPDLPEPDRWWARCGFDDLTEVPAGLRLGEIGNAATHGDAQREETDDPTPDTPTTTGPHKRF